MITRSALIIKLNRYPRIKGVIKLIRDWVFTRGGPVSSDYLVLKEGEIDDQSRFLKTAWQNDEIPLRQRNLLEQQLALYRGGARVDVFDVFVKALKVLPKMTENAMLLEIGCSSGHYSEVIEVAGLPFKYTGCDYSLPFIKLAKKLYPRFDFSVQDATELAYVNESFDVVVSGCCLLHIPEYRLAISEAIRVSRNYVIFHRTPVVWGKPEQWYRKKAYGVDTVEIHFNENKLLSFFENCGVKVIETLSLADAPNKSCGDAVRTYVCQKI